MNPLLVLAILLLCFAIWRLNRSVSFLIADLCCAAAFGLTVVVMVTWP